MATVVGLQSHTETIRDPTPPERWDRLKRLFQAALDQPADRRAAWVRSEAAGEPGLADEVLALLAAEDEGSLGVPRVGDPPPVAPAIAELSRVGAYVIEGELASGGMGRVFRARRDNPRRAAAVKLMNRALHDANAIRRFDPLDAARAEGRSGRSM
jgi:serine/threonine-protein kinase